VTIPASDPGSTASAAPASAALAMPLRQSRSRSTPQGLSRDFASAAIAALAEMRDAGTIRMITYGLAVSDTWAQDDHVA